MSQSFDVRSLMSHNPPQPPHPLIPWQSVRADISFICVLVGHEVTMALREFRDHGRPMGVSFSDARGGGFPSSTWIDWTGFEA